MLCRNATYAFVLGNAGASRPSDRRTSNVSAGMRDRLNGHASATDPAIFGSGVLGPTPNISKRFSSLISKHCKYVHPGYNS